MTEPKKRRGRGEGALFWDEAKERWVADVTVGYTPAGKRIRRKASGRTKTEARANLRELLPTNEDGLAIARSGTVLPAPCAPGYRCPHRWTGPALPMARSAETIRSRAVQ